MMKRSLRYVALALGLAAAGAALAEVTFYEREEFRGRSFTVSNPVPDFTQFGFNNRASSAVVRSGQYVVCDAAGFRGHCVRLGPGSYRTLTGMGLNNRVSSARPAGSPGAGVPRAVLFEQPNFNGRHVVLEGNQVIREFAGSGFDNRMSSLRVERGNWIFCSAANFQGDCRTFGPGDYRHLPRELDNRISSGRAEGWDDASSERRQREIDAERRRDRDEQRRENRD